MKRQVAARCANVPAVAVVLTLLLLLTAFHVNGQTVTGTILGDVLDPSGAAVPNVSITITNQDTGVIRATMATADGVYSVPSLLPGKYTVDAKAAGFSPVEVKDVTVAIGSDARVDLRLSLGTTTQNVIVTDATQSIETTSPEVSQVVDENLIKDIPLNARDLQQLAEIQPGVQFNYYSPFGRQLAIVGDRPTHNRYLQEGVDTTVTYRTAALSLAGVLLGVEAVKEFKVLSTDFGAEYGELSGGTINTLFKSGTNRFHGSAYEYFRDSSFDTRNYFDQGSVPPFRRHQFGGSAGGPIRKDKTFFFTNYEGFRQHLGQSFTTNVPDANARAGSLPCQVTTAGCGTKPTGTLVPVTVNPAISQIFFAGSNPLMPACNGANLGGGVCKYLSSPVLTIEENYGLVKIDHTFGMKDTLSSTYNIDRSTEGSPTNYPSVADDQVIQRQTFTLQETHILSTNVVNTLRFGINRQFLSLYLDTLTDLAPSLFVNPKPVYTPSPFPQVPSITVTSLTPFGSTSTGSTFPPRWIGYTSGLLTDDVNYLHGKHAFQFGVQAKKWHDNTEIYNAVSRGTYTFTGLQQFLTGGPAQTFTWNVQNLSSEGRGIRMGLIALYGEDTYKIKPNLTLTAGLRWEWVPGPGEYENRVSNINNPTPVTAGSVITGGSYFHPSAHDFAPRLGFNWDPFKKGNMSVRGGIGVFYNQIEDDTWYAQIGGQPPFTTQVTLSNTMPLPADLSKVSVAGLHPNYTGWIPTDPKTPTKVGYNLAIQHDLPSHMNFMIAYVGAQTRHLGRVMSWQDYVPLTLFPGQAPPGGTANPSCTIAGQLTCLYWPGVGLQNANIIGVTNPNATLCAPPAVTKTCFNNNNFGATISGTNFDGTGSYNALQTALERRMSPGLFVRFNYTWSSCVTDATDDQAGGATNGGSSGPVVARDRRSSRARCNFQGTNAANLTVAYDLAFGRNLKSGFARRVADGWQVTSLTTVTSGVPFDVRDGLNVSRYATSGTGLDRPDWAPGCNPHNAVNTHSVFYVNTACFKPAPLGYLGNVGALPLTSAALVNTDISLKKMIPIRESMNIQLGADMFNAFNRTNFAAPSTITMFTNAGTAAAPAPVISATAGQITQTIGTSRQLQISARFQF